VSPSHVTIIREIASYWTSLDFERLVLVFLVKMLKIETLARSSLGNKKRANNSYGRPGLETNDIAVYFESPATNRTQLHVFVVRHLVLPNRLRLSTGCDCKTWNRFFMSRNKFYMWFHNALEIQISLNKTRGRCITKHVMSHWKIQYVGHCTIPCGIFWNNQEAGELLERTVQFYISDYFLQANTFDFLMLFIYVFCTSWIKRVHIVTT